MGKRTNLISSIIEKLPDVKIIRTFETKNEITYGRVELNQSGICLDFEVEVLSYYPLQIRENESIRFLNSELIIYNHVNRDGSICIHTYHNPNIKDKLELDFNSLKDWINKYYLAKREDAHYEHIVVNEHQGEILSSYLFTEVDYNFSKNSFGYFNYSLQAIGKEVQKERHTFLVHSFLVGKTPILCSWSNHYNQQRNFSHGIYVYIDSPPVKHRRFAVESWSELEPFVSQDFLKFLDNNNKNGFFKKLGSKKFPLFIGYKTPSEEIHWQCATIDTDNFPNKSVEFETGWGGEFKEMPINWSSTKNCSYNYFFGRGKFSDKITEKKIMIIGVGAIGSIVATTLTRCGSKFIALIDYDVKEPENVCRSEFDFNTGVSNKVDELGIKLTNISPFIELKLGNSLTDALKFFVVNDYVPKQMIDIIEDYDIIIDCTSDDDVAYILDSLDLKSEVISFSITNNAKELLCSVKPNLYQWLMSRDSFITNSDETLYMPTGCWNPTFKASYNDINSLVQFALKHINFMIDSGKQLRHFYLSSETDNGYNIKMHQF